MSDVKLEFASVDYNCVLLHMEILNAALFKL